MPLYEYKCHGCGKTFEVIQKFSDEPLRTHSECGGEVERLISTSALQFKGSGWYVTDYAKKSNGGSKTEGGPDHKPDSKSDSGEKKSDAKPSGESKTPAASETKPSSTSSTTSDSK